MSKLVVHKKSIETGYPICWIKFRIGQVYTSSYKAELVTCANCVRILLEEI